MIDYKTGQASVKAWLGERPDEPQLPLYAVGRSGPEPIDGAAFARLRTGDLRFAGMARDQDLIAGVDPIQKAAPALGDWDRAVVAWREALSALGRGFATGDAEVDPKEGELTCRYCDLQGLCRISERSTVPTFDEGEGGRMPGEGA